MVNGSLAEHLVIVARAGSCRLIALSDHHASDKPPVIVVPDLARDTVASRFVSPLHLSALLTTVGQNLYVVQWDQPWSNGSTGRFSPLVRDLDLMVSSLGGHQPFHMTTIGSGAIPAFKWMSTRSRNDLPQRAASLTLFAPTMTVQGRTPRTSLSQAPDRTSIISDDAGRAADVTELLSLAARLPCDPNVLLTRGVDSYLQVNDFNTKDSTQESVRAHSVEFSGSWKPAWRDWLTDHALSPDTIAKAS